MNYFISAFKRAFDFSGRSTRKEFWIYYLFIVIISIALQVVSLYLPFDSSIIYTIMSIYGLAIFITTLSCMIRRLHDINKSGWYMFTLLVPIFGTFILLFLLTLPTNNIENRYTY